MLVKVTKDTVKIVDDDYILNKGEYKVNRCYFVFSEEYTDNLIKKAIFEHGETKIEMVIVNDECDIPYEVLNFNTFELRVYAYQVDSISEELILRYSPTYTNAYLRAGSYDADATQGEEITPSQYEQYEQALNDGLVEVNNKLVDVDTAIEETNNLNITASKLANITTLALTKKDATVQTVQILDGAQGEQGEKGKDAKINGVNSLTIEAGENITLEQQGDTLTINSTGEISMGGWEIVQTLPTQDISDNIIYLVPSLEPETQNLYDEYIYINNSWEKIGSKSINLSDYYTKTQTDSLLEEKQEILQFDTMPSASSFPTNALIQYVGQTNNNYKNGHWYRNNTIVFYGVDYAIIPSGVYINTGIIPSNHKVEISYAWNEYIFDSHLIGTNNTSQDPAWYIHFTSYNNRYYWGRNGEEMNGGSFTTGHHIVTFNDGENNDLKLDNTILDSALCASEEPLTLFMRSNVANFAGNFYYLKVWNKETDELILHLVPVIDENDNVLFYDIITETFLNTEGGNATGYGSTTGETYGNYGWTLVDDYIAENKIKNTYSTTAHDVYDVRYINSLIGDINSVLSTLTTPNNGGGN